MKNTFYGRIPLGVLSGNQGSNFYDLTIFTTNNKHVFEVLKVQIQKSCREQEVRAQDQED